MDRAVKVARGIGLCVWLCVWNGKHEQDKHSVISNFLSGSARQCPLPMYCGILGWPVSGVNHFMVCGIGSPSLFQRGGAVFWVMVMVTDIKGTASASRVVIFCMGQIIPCRLFCFFSFFLPVFFFLKIREASIWWHLVDW